MELLLPKQPQPNYQLLKRSLRLYRASFSKIILWSFLLALVFFAPRILLELTGKNLFFDLPPLHPQRLLWLELFNVINLMFFIAIIWGMYCTVKHKHEPLLDDIKISAKKILSVFCAAILQNLFILIVFFVVTIFNMWLIQHQLSLTGNWLSALFLGLLIIGECFLFFYVSMLFLFFLPLIVIENKGMIGALRGSGKLVWNHWWRTFSLQVIPWIVYLLIAFLLLSFFQVDIHFFASVTNFMQLILQIIVTMLFTPWIAALLLVQLKDLELRKKAHL